MGEIDLLVYGLNRQSYSVFGMWPSPSPHAGIFSIEKRFHNKPVKSHPAGSENSQQITNEHDHQNGAQPDANASAGAPLPVAVVSSSAAENQDQNNNQYDRHFRSPSFQVATLVRIAMSIPGGNAP